ncbi:MAG: hypothetical protein WC379_13250 [Methanoregula sp.]
MKYGVLVLMGILISGIFFAGCTQSSGTGPVPTTVPVPSPSPTEAVTVTATSTPHEVVTIIRHVSQTRDVKDSELLFSLQVPVEWDVTTYRLKNSDITEGLLYQTDLIGDDVFNIHTYAISRGQDQAYRDEFRMWSPAPAETTVTMNDITFDRFESTLDGKTRIAYVVRKSSANERGYASVLFFSSDTSNPFEKEDFEKVVSSFRYLTGNTVGTMAGEEIPRIAAIEDLSGSAMSKKSGSSESGVSSGGCSCCRG